MGTILEIIDSTIFYSYVVSLAGAQIQTAVFLKTFNVNTIDTKTTGWIILAMEVFCLCMGVITNLYMPPWKADRSKTEICEFSTPEAFHRFTIPTAVVQVIVLIVIGLTLFRSHQIKRKRNNAEQFCVEGGAASASALIPRRAVISELNRESEENDGPHSENMDDDIVVGEIELGNLETSEFISEINIETEENHESHSENMDDDIVVGEIELGNLETSEIISELNIESEENHETHSENMDDDLVVGEIELGNLETYRDSEDIHETHSENMEVDIVVEETEFVSKEISELERDFKERHDRPVVVETVNLKETPPKIEQLKIRKLIIVVYQEYVS